MYNGDEHWSIFGVLMTVKRIVTIITMILFLITGMNMFVAYHYCNGKLAGEKISFKGTSTACDMAGQSEEKSGNQTIDYIDCCSEHIACFSLNDFTVTIPTETVVPSQRIFHPPVIPEGLTLNNEFLFKTSSTAIRASGIFNPDIHSCPVICVFRI